TGMGAAEPRSGAGSETAEAQRGRASGPGKPVGGDLARSAGSARDCAGRQFLRLGWTFATGSAPGVSDRAPVRAAAQPGVVVRVQYAGADGPLDWQSGGASGRRKRNRSVGTAAGDAAADVL